MASEQPHEASIFNAARNLSSREARADYLAEACGDDTALRDRVEKLLAAFDAESQFLEQPAPGLEPTIVSEALSQDRASSLDVGLTAAFSIDHAVVIGDQHHSVLKMLGRTLDSVPRVALRDEAGSGADPIVRPQSPEIPKSNSDSRYQLQGEIARGGMGAILKGRDTDLGRDLAIKVLLDAHKDNPQVIQRFIEEAQIGGQLQHPGIAPVYELGQFADQRPFFSMKLVKGETLSKLLADREDAAEERGKFIGIFEQICQTMAYAHSRGVIHRDLKPANIMVGAFGEVQVMDWGLAKVLQTGGVADEKSAKQKQQGQSIIQTMRSIGSDAPGSFGSHGSGGSETQMGSVMGTPAYMPPEQALGEIDQMDQRADVFGLGAILAEILTGKPPYVGDDGTQVYRLASRGKLDDCFARLDACGADHDLILLTKHCLEREPAARPEDASDVSARVTDYLESVETKLRETELQCASEAARVVEQKKRFRVTLALAVAVIGLILGGGSFAWWQNQQVQLVVQREVRNGEAVAALVQQCIDALLARDTAKAAVALEAAAKRSEERGAEQYRDQLEFLAADIELIREIADLNQLQWSTVADEYEVEWQSLGPRMRSALSRFGAEPSVASIDYIKVRVSQSAVPEKYIATLDQLLRLSGDLTIKEVLKALDVDEYRNSIREAIFQKDANRIAELAAMENALQQPPPFTAFLGELEEIPRERRQRLLQSALFDYPDDVNLLITMGNTYLDLENGFLPLPMGNPKFYEQVRWYQAAAAVSRDASAFDTLSWALRAAGDLESSTAYIRKAIEIDPNGANRYVTLGVSLSSHDEAGAISCFEKAISLQPNEPNNYLRLASALTRKDEWGKAFALFQKAIELAPDDAQYLHALGDALKEKGDLDEAIVFYQRAIDLEPNPALGYSKLGDALLEQGHLKLAIGMFEKAIDVKPRVFVYYNKLAAALESNNETEKAIANYRKAIEIQPSDGFTHYALGAALAKLGASDAAIASFRRATELVPYFPNFHLFLGLEFKRKGDWESAKASFRTASELDPNNAYFRTELGHALWSNAEKQPAISAYQNAMKLDPSPARYNECAATLLTSPDKDGAYSFLEQAVEWARKATELSPNDNAFRATLGFALYRSSKWQEACEQLQISLAPEPNMPTNWLFLAMTYWQLGERAKAQEWYDKSIAWKTSHAEELQEDAELQGFFAEAAELMATDESSEIIMTSPAESSR